MKRVLKYTAPLLLAGAAHGQIPATYGVSFPESYNTVDGEQDFDPTSATFALGIFIVPGTTNTPFIPTLDNLESWDDAWREIDSLTPTIDGMGVVQDETRQIEFETGGIETVAPAMATTTSLNIGSRVYLWGYRDGINSYDPASGVQPEWFLTTNDNNPNDPGYGDGTLATTENWILPDSSLPADSHDSVNTFWLANVGDVPIAGFVNQNNGAISFIAVPEPSSALLAILGFLGFAARRQR